MLPPGGSIRMGVAKTDHLLAPGSSPGWIYICTQQRSRGFWHASESIVSHSSGQNRFGRRTPAEMAQIPTGIQNRKLSIQSKSEGWWWLAGVQGGVAAGQQCQSDESWSAPAPTPPWRQLRGKSQVTFPHMLPPGGSIRMGVDQRNHLFAPGLSPGWSFGYG